MPSDDVLSQDWKALPRGFDGNAFEALPSYGNRPWFGPIVGGRKVGDQLDRLAS